MNIHQSNSYRKLFSWIHFGNELMVQKRQPPIPYICFCSLLTHPSTSQQHQWRNGKNITWKPVWQVYIYKSNFTIKRIYMTNQGSNFYGGNPSNRDNVRDLVQFKKMLYLQEQTHPFLYQQHQSYQTGQTKQVQFFEHLNKLATSCSSSRCLEGQVKIQKPALGVATSRIPDHNQGEEQ